MTTPAQIKHIAIITDRYTLLARFYEAVFGMWTFPGKVEAAAMAVSDGHVGLNFNLRPPGRQAGLDHFGFEVGNLDEVLDKATKFPNVDYLRRPSNRPFAGLSMNDPAGNVFDLAHKEPERLDSVYASGNGRRNTPRHISHFVLCALKPEILAEFYREVFALLELPRNDGDPNFYLSDGKVMMIIAPWKIKDYQGTGVARPAMDHLGFTVENLETFERDLKELAAANTALAPVPLTTTKENVCRLELLKRSAPGQVQFCDPDGVLLTVKEAA
jgi:predicted enzyme related to lactoylglutathione lyase